VKELISGQVDKIQKENWKESSVEDPGEVRRTKEKYHESVGRPQET